MDVDVSYTITIQGKLRVDADPEMPSADITNLVDNKVRHQIGGPAQAPVAFSWTAADGRFGGRTY